MHIDDKKFILSLSPAEIIYAASLSGFNKLHLIKLPEPKNIEQLLHDGAHSLQSRKLILPGSNGEVALDDLLFSLIHWIALPQWALHFDIQHINKQEDIILFYKNGYLCCQAHDQQIDFLVFKSDIDLQNHVFNIAGLNQRPIPNQQLPLYNPIEIDCFCEIWFYEYYLGLPSLKGVKKFASNPMCLYVGQVASDRQLRYVPLSHSSIEALELL